MSGLGPNALEPCGTSTAKRRHVALAEHCSTCGTQGRRTRRLLLDELVAERRRMADALNGNPTDFLATVPDGVA